MIEWAVLGSGSSGNAYYISDGDHSIIIDQGYSVVELNRRLARVNRSVDHIDALFVTHFHPDHTRGVGVFSRRRAVPIHLSAHALAQNKRAVHSLGIPTDQITPIDHGEVIQVGEMSIFCFATSHDSPGSVGYFIDHPSERLLLMTDLGQTTAEQASLAKDASVLFLEANYDDHLLEVGPYPYPLKERIRSREGHLSNDQALEFLSHSGFDGKEVYFVHISDTNNDYELLENQAREIVSAPFVVCEKNCWYGMIGATL